MRLTLDVDVVYRSPENIARLVAVKRAAGRPKDLEAVAEIEAIEEDSAFYFSPAFSAVPI